MTSHSSRMILLNYKIVVQPPELPFGALSEPLVTLLVRQHAKGNHMADQPVSTKATGVSGIIFEYRVAGIMLSRMIRGAHMPVGFQLPVARVAFQQRNRGFPFDDIVAFSAVSQEAKCIQIQVKENINLTGADPKFIELMAAAAQVCRQHPEELQKGDLRLALAAGGPAQDLKELSDLADKAVGQLSPAGLAELLVEGAVSSKMRNRYQHVVRAVTATGMATSGTMAEELTYQILSALHVWPVQAGPDGRDWRIELDALRNLRNIVPENPVHTLVELCSIAQEFGPHGAELSYPQIAKLLSLRGIRIADGGPGSGSTGSKYNIINNDNGKVIAGDNLTFYGFTM